MIRLSRDSRETLQAVAVTVLAFAFFSGALWLLRRTWAEQDARKAAERKARIIEQRELDRRFRILEQEPRTTPKTNQ